MTSLSETPPIFQDIFGDAWHRLPLVMRRHYANRPFSDDQYRVEGRLDVSSSGPIKLFALFFRLMGLIPPENEQQVPVTVVFRSELDSSNFQFDRQFYFQSRQYRFLSKMRQVSGNEVVEVMKYGIAWRMHYCWEDDRVKLKHRGYALSLFSKLIPLPIEPLLGRGYAEEIPVDDDHFDMKVVMIHTLWGEIYQYSGRFEVKL